MDSHPCGPLVVLWPNVNYDVNPLLDVLPLQPANAPAFRIWDCTEIAVVDSDDSRVVESKVDVSLDQCSEGYPGVICVRANAPLPLIAKARADIEQHLAQHGILAGEVPV